MITTLPRVPQHADMLSYKIVATGEFPRTQYTVVFDYPRCTRTFDGREWTVTTKGDPAWT